MTVRIKAASRGVEKPKPSDVHTLALSTLIAMKIREGTLAVALDVVKPGLSLDVFLEACRDAYVRAVYTEERTIEAGSAVARVSRKRWRAALESAGVRSVVRRSTATDDGVALGGPLLEPSPSEVSRG